MRSSLGAVAYGFFVGTHGMWLIYTMLTGHVTLGVACMVLHILCIKSVIKSALEIEFYEREIEKMDRAGEALRDITTLLARLHALETIERWKELEGVKDEPARIE